MQETPTPEKEIENPYLNLTDVKDDNEQFMDGLQKG